MIIKVVNRSAFIESAPYQSRELYMEEIRKLITDKLALQILPVIHDRGGMAPLSEIVDKVPMSIDLTAVMLSQLVAYKFLQADIAEFALTPIASDIAQVIEGYREIEEVHTVIELQTIA